jgi:hypothetical protein
MPQQIQPHVAMCLIIRRPSEGALVWADKGLQMTNGSDYRYQHRDLAIKQIRLQPCDIYHWHAFDRKETFNHSTTISNQITYKSITKQISILQ